MMSEVIHLVCSESLPTKLRSWGLEGEVLVWRDPMIEGPAMQHVPLEQLFEVRSQYLQTHFNHSPQRYQTGVVHVFEQLSQPSVKQIYFWFDHDLSSQVCLSFLLSTLSIIGKEVYLMVPELFDHKGMYLHQLNTPTIRSMYNTRVAATSASLAPWRGLWYAYSANHPAGINAILKAPANNFIDKLAILHAGRYPHCLNGVNDIEQQVLSLLASEDAADAESLYRRFNAEHNPWGLSDIQLMSVMLRLEEGPKPLITTTNGVARLTQLGHDIMNFEVDYLAFYQPNRWLGGVQLQKGQTFRWDPFIRELR